MHDSPHAQTPGCLKTHFQNTLSDEFKQDVLRSKGVLEDVLGQPISGYRAPCFSLDRQRLDVLQEAGYQYDSSRIEFGDHPLYGTIEMTGYAEPVPGIFAKVEFVEFEISTLRILGKNIPVSGGGYLRLFPWMLMKGLLKRYLKGHEVYVLYIHPFELSPQPSPPLPEDTARRTQFRFEHGRESVPGKLRALIRLLRQQGFSFTTFAALRKQLLAAQPSRV